MRLGIKTHIVTGFQKMQNKNVVFDFPVLYPSTHYFGNIHELLRSYEIVLTQLLKHHFDFQAYCEDLVNNPYLFATVEEKETFEIQGGDYKDCPLVEHVFNEENEILWETYYVTNPKRIVLKEENTYMPVQLHISLGDDYNLYINGSSMFAKINKKSFVVFVD